MANRRCFKALTSHAAALFSANRSLKILTETPPSLPNLVPHELLNARFLPIFYCTGKTTWSSPSYCTRHFSSNREDDGNEDSGDEVSHSEDEDEGEEWEDGSDDESVAVSSGDRREINVRDKEAEAAAIGYKVIGSLAKDDRVFKPYEPVFAVVQIGSHQFKVSNGDCIFTERLKFCEVNDKLILNKVLLLGSSSQTIVGRPILPGAAVHAVVEEHALDAKVIIFKKKRRKNYRRTKGHRQELTKLRITDIQGIEKPENVVNDKASKAAKKIEKVAVAS